MTERYGCHWNGETEFCDGCGYGDYCEYQNMYTIKPRSCLGGMEMKVLEGGKCNGCYGISRDNLSCNASCEECKHSGGNPRICKRCRLYENNHSFKGCRFARNKFGEVNRNIKCEHSLVCGDYNSVKCKSCKHSEKKKSYYESLD